MQALKNIIKIITPSLLTNECVKKRKKTYLPATYQSFEYILSSSLHRKKSKAQSELLFILQMRKIGFGKFKYISQDHKARK